MKESERIKYLLDKVSNKIKSNDKKMLSDGHTMCKNEFLKAVRKSHLDLQMEREEEGVLNE